MQQKSTFKLAGNNLEYNTLKSSTTLDVINSKAQSQTIHKLCNSKILRDMNCKNDLHNLLIDSVELACLLTKERKLAS